jgi:hypothetical protein
MNKKEQDYWVREVDTHLRAFSKKLLYAIQWMDTGPSKFIISAGGKLEYFNMADKFIAKAPAIEGWELMALQPPFLFQNELFVDKAFKVGIDLTTCWLEPPPAEREDKVRINVFAEVYQGITYEMKEAVTDYLWNILGERVYGSEVEFTSLDSIFQLQDAKRKEKLVPLNTAAEHILLRERPEFFIGADGALKAKN